MRMSVSSPDLGCAEWLLNCTIAQPTRIDKTTVEALTNPFRRRTPEINFLYLWLQEALDDEESQSDSR